MSVSLCPVPCQGTSYPKTGVPFDGQKFTTTSLPWKPPPRRLRRLPARRERGCRSDGQENTPEPGADVPGPLRRFRLATRPRQGVGNPLSGDSAPRFPRGATFLRGAPDPGSPVFRHRAVRAALLRPLPFRASGSRRAGSPPPRRVPDQRAALRLSLRGPGKKFAEASHPIAGREKRTISVSRKPLTRRFGIPVSRVGDADTYRRDIFRSYAGRGDSPTLSVDEDLRAGGEATRPGVPLRYGAAPDRFPCGQHLWEKGRDPG